MSNSVVELRVKVLKRYAVSFSLHKSHGDVPPLNLSSNENLYLLCVQVSHTLTGGFG